MRQILKSSDMSRKVLFLGSNKVVAEDLPVHVCDDLDDDALSDFAASVGCDIPVVDADDGTLKQIDYVTRAYWLQTQLMPFLPSCTVHYEVRAFANSSLDLTLKPAQWSQYYAAYDTGLNLKVAQSLNDELTAAWNYLKENEDAPIIVTFHREEETTLERLKKTHPENVRHLWKSLPDRLKKNMRVTVAFLATGQIMLEDADHAKDSLEANVAYAAAHMCDKLQRYIADAPMHNDARFAAKMSEVLAKVDGRHRQCTNWCLDYTKCPQRVHDNVFSDVVHQTLSRTEYTRDEVLARVKMCGSVIMLHDPRFRSDVEIVTEALKANYSGVLECDGEARHCIMLGRDMLDNKSVMIAAVSQHPSWYKLASDELEEDPDVYLPLLKKHGRRGSLLIPKRVVQTDAVAATHRLFDGLCYVESKTELLIDKETALGIVARDASAVDNLFAMTKPAPVYCKNRQAAARKLLQDRSFIRACIAKNWRVLVTSNWLAVQMLLNARKRKLGFDSLHAQHHAPAYVSPSAVKTQLFLHFGPAKLAALYFVGNLNLVGALWTSKVDGFALC